MNNQIWDVTEVMLELPTNGFITITLLIKHVHHIKLTVMTMVSDAPQKLNAEIVSLIKDVGLKKEQKFIVSMSSEMLLVKKT